jgi:hypothetical protein
MIRATNQRALAMDGLTVITSRVDGFEGFATPFTARMSM